MQLPVTVIELPKAFRDTLGAGDIVIVPFFDRYVVRRVFVNSDKIKGVYLGGLFNPLTELEKTYTPEW